MNYRFWFPILIYYFRSVFWVIFPITKPFLKCLGSYMSVLSFIKIRHWTAGIYQ